MRGWGSVVSGELRLCVSVSLLLSVSPAVSARLPLWQRGTASVSASVAVFRVCWCPTSTVSVTSPCLRP
eukprot:654742-Rhodomonas_salina.6